MSFFTVFCLAAGLFGVIQASSFQGTAQQDADFDNLVDIDLGNPEAENNVPGAPLSPHDFEMAIHVSTEMPPRDQMAGDPIELAGLFEGDISGVQEYGSQPSSWTKNAIRDKALRWPRGEIPYVIEASFTQNERYVIARAMLEYHNNTCIRYVPRTNQRDYIYIQKGAGCSSNVGRTGGAQSVSLGSGCVYVGIVIHEFMHATGFWHEQSRADRDDYITIVENNIQNGMAYNFMKYSLSQIQYLGAPYDTGSVMHYDAYAFAKDRYHPTIVPKQQGVELGQRRGFSQWDMYKINILYGCESNGHSALVTPTPIPLVSTPMPGQCADIGKYCSAWAGSGQCAQNAAWMNINCRKSCNQCGDSCADQSVNCKQWANSGECTRNKGYMNVYCPKTCGVCGSGGITDTCMDGSNYCSAWAARGQCQSNPNYMAANCKKSCNSC